MFGFKKKKVERVKTANEKAMETAIAKMRNAEQLLNYAHPQDHSTIDASALLYESAEKEADAIRILSGGGA